MGSAISKDQCPAQFNVTLDCTVDGTNHTDGNGKTIMEAPFTRIGNYTKGDFPGDPDIAGIGILGVFVAVTSFAIVLGFLAAMWEITKTCRDKTRSSKKQRIKREDRKSVSDILESLILAASDQQVFTGGAYALTLQYWRGCTISAYHYNIVANMMLLTCATHLISVTIIRNYWKFPWLAILRIACISFVFTATGQLMTRQNADMEMDFPTAVPNANETDSPIFLPAACFQNGGPTAMTTLQEATKNASTFFGDSIANSTPRNKIQGFNLYIVCLLFYIAAIMAEAIRFVRRGEDGRGPRAWICKQFGRCFRVGTPQRGVMHFIYLLYMLVGVAISTLTTGYSAKYIFDLRGWVNKSGWILLGSGQNPENDAKTFGQLVPIFSTALIVFGFAQIISEKCTQRRSRGGDDEETNIQYNSGNGYAPVPLGILEKDQGGYFGAAAGMSMNSLPPRGNLQHQMSWSSETNVGSSQGATPLLSSDAFLTQHPSGYSYSPPMPAYPIRPQVQTHSRNSSSSRQHAVAVST